MDISLGHLFLYNRVRIIINPKGKEAFAMTKTDVLERIDELCHERTWTRYELAKEAGIPVSSVYNMYSHKGFPKIKTIEKICDGFQITMEEFFSPIDGREVMTEDDMLLIERFRRLPEEKRGELIAYWDGLENNK